MMLLALLLAQVQPLNLNQQPTLVRDEGSAVSSVRAITVNCVGAGVTCTQSGTTWTLTVAGGGGAPTSATYITQTPDATLTNEQALSALSTGLVVNTTATGVLTIYTGASCTNQFIRALSASGAATCASVDLATDVTGLLADSSLASNYSGTGACAANTFATTLNDNASPTCTAVNDATGVLKGGVVLAGDLSGTAASPSVVDDSHTHTGTTISALDTSDITTGTLGQARGGTGAGALTCAAGERLTSNGTAYSCSAVVTQAYATVEDEATPLTQRSTVNFTGAGVSCADSGGKTVCTISSGGGGGGTSPLSVVLGTP